MGLQLFTIRQDLAKDLEGTLAKVKAIGYQDSETYGYDPDQQTFYGVKAADFKKMLDDNSLTTTSGHYNFHPFMMNKSMDELAKFTDSCIVGAKALDQKYITWPWLDPSTRTIEHFKQLVDKLNFVGERVVKSGLGFAYHNHDYEFFESNGTTGYDIVMKETDPKLVKLQIDLYWVARDSKRSAPELIALQPGRFVMWHIKDMDPKSRDYSELGNGTVDFTKTLPLASKAGMEYYYIEQGGNFQKNPIQSITDSAAYWKKNLEKYLA
ncbi:MAG TPA: sugar phosphate isomerase/epimerase [Cyclobacteriaceae bacterium]|nr:sugar phosphate isomerase/epimerase [Cyclobacteriaceae bacterium]